MTEHRPTAFSSPGELADLLPKLLGQRPDNSVAVVGFGGQHRSGGVLRADLPADPARWPGLAEALITSLENVSEQHGDPARTAALFVCPTPADSRDGLEGRERHEPMGRLLAEACARHGIEVMCNLYLTRTHWWPVASAAHDDESAGTPLPAAASAAPGDRDAAKDALNSMRSRAEINALHTASTGPEAEPLRRSLREALRWLGDELECAGSEQAAVERYADLLDTLLCEPTDPAEISDEKVAQLIVGIQNGLVLEIAADYVEPAELPAAQALWRRLARACVEPYGSYAAAPLFLLGHAAWVGGDLLMARISLESAVAAKPDQGAAQLLLSIVNMQDSLSTLGSEMGIVQQFREEQRARRAERRAAREG